MYEERIPRSEQETIITWVKNERKWYFYSDDPVHIKKWRKHIVVWFSLIWSLEFYQQANARLDRQGQTQPVIIHHLVTKGTIDERIMKVLRGKAKSQNELLAAVKARINEVKNGV